MRLFDRLTGGGEKTSRVIPPREARSWAPSPVINLARSLFAEPDRQALECALHGDTVADLERGLIPRVLEMAIATADFSFREPDDEGERIAVFCTALGRGFIYDRDEADRRVRKRFPGLSDEGVSLAVDHLENHIKAFAKPFRHDARKKSSWVHGWR